MAVNMVETAPTADSLADNGSKLTSSEENYHLSRNAHALGGPGWTHMNEPIRLVHSAARVG